MMPGTEAQLQKEMTTAYIGFDPTADSLHIGNLATMMLLKHFQLSGHKPLILVGGATGRIGDPSGKKAERTLLEPEEVERNIAGQLSQMRKFLNFDEGDNRAEIVNNYDWFKDIGFIDFLREAGKHLPVNYMMAKDSVKTRLESGGLSFAEFSYQLLQAYDFYHLYSTRNCRLQMGGSDQWGNITSGTELIRRKCGGEAFALTTPLVTKADGTKFGKSEQGNVWLDAARTSPYKFYQFWINVNDADLPKLLRVFTLMSREEIEALEAQNNPQHTKQVLAEYMTTFIHSAEEAQQVQQASRLLFDKKASMDAFEALPDALFADVVEVLPSRSFTVEQWAACTSTVDLLAEALEISKGEVRRSIKANALSINKQKVSEAQSNDSPDVWPLIKGKYLLLQNGKKQHIAQKLA